MIFFCYSQLDDASIKSSLGDADYSYYFVLKAYEPLLKRLGEVRTISVIDEAFIRECEDLTKTEVSCYLLAFAPPHKVPLGLPCPVIPVFAWEYSSIPNRNFINDPQDNWCLALENFGQAITHSSYAKRVVQADLGEDFAIESIPAPLWDSCTNLRDNAPERPPVKDKRLTLGTAVIDTWDFDIESESIAPSTDNGAEQAAAIAQDEPCRPISIKFGENNPDVWMVGFYAPEGWGAWSRSANPWIMLPSVVSGSIRLKVSLNASGDNVGRDIAVSVGDATVSLQPTAELTEYDFELDVRRPGHFLLFTGIDLSVPASVEDPRSLGIGLASLSIEPLNAMTDPGTAEASESSATHLSANVVQHDIDLRGVVYTSILNPRDGRKNWEDILTAFCLAFRDNPQATLILKMTYKDMSGYLEDIFTLFCQLHPFVCRVIIIHGYISDEDYVALAESTSFIVNASRSEGQCLPLMEYMSSGIPAIAPDNTAMADYITVENAFIVDSSPEPHYWPHDPQQIYTTLWYRPSWESLHKGYLQSYDVANSDVQRYREMSKAAWQSLYKFCSCEMLEPKLSRLLTKTKNIELP